MESTLLGEKKELTNLQKDFISKSVCLDDKGKIIFASKDPNVKYEVLFRTIVNNNTRDFRVPKEMFNKDMRSWITQLLINSPYGKIFNNPDGNIEQELETYNEMCKTKNPEEMEWGVVQKLISMILIADVGFFKVSKEFRNETTCIHTEKTYDALRLGVCERCHGNGIRDTEKVPSEEEIVLANYLNIINQCKKIQLYILDKIIDIKEAALMEIWYNKMTHTERFNANGEIAKANPKTMKQQSNIIHATS